MPSRRGGASPTSMGPSAEEPLTNSVSIETFWVNAWYQGSWWLWLLWPVSLLMRALAACRRRYLSSRCEPLPAPVVVIGNISLGGTGKTPLIIALVRYLQSLGLKPGVISRGYGGQAPHYPYLVTPNSPVAASGDEPLLIAIEAQCPVAIGADRVASVRELADKHQCNIILSDDGLQHYRLARQWEICLLDGKRWLGNGLCLPAGPLREPPQRLRQVDCVLINGQFSTERALPKGVEAQTFTLEATCWVNVLSGARLPLDQLQCVKDPVVNAVTGIGNPQRFFDSLRQLGVSVRGRAFPDHYAFQAEDLAYVGSKPLLMTAKDAVKCQSFARENWWYLSVEARWSDAFEELLSRFLQEQGLQRATSD